MFKILGCIAVCVQVHKSQDVASRRGKLTTEDIMFLVRKVCYLLLLIIFWIVMSNSVIVVLKAVLHHFFLRTL